MTELRLRQIEEDACTDYERELVEALREARRLIQRARYRSWAHPELTKDTLTEYMVEVGMEIWT